MKNKIDINIYKDGFTSEAIQSISEVYGSHSAGAGTFDPGRIAEHYVGIQPSTGDTIAYCIRRFGFPAIGADDYKDICQWIVTTPMKGVWLGISSGSGSVFRYVITNELAIKIDKEINANAQLWSDKFREWAKAEKGVVLVARFFRYKCETEEETFAEFVKWGSEKYGVDWDKADSIEGLGTLVGKTAEEIKSLFFDEKESQAAVLEDEFEKIEPRSWNDPNYRFPYFESTGNAKLIFNTCSHLCKFPKFKVLRNFLLGVYHKLRARQESEFCKVPFWMQLPGDSITRKVNEALYRTILDMLRPVYVRDWDLNITGEFDDSEVYEFTEWDDETDKKIYDYTAPIDEMAGCGVDRETIGNPDWYALKKALIAKYGGLREGIKQTRTLLEVKQTKSEVQEEIK